MKYLIKCSKRFEDKFGIHNQQLYLLRFGNVVIVQSFLAMLLSYSIDGRCDEIQLAYSSNLQLVRVPWQCCC